MPTPDGIHMFIVAAVYLAVINHDKKLLSEITQPYYFASDPVYLFDVDGKKMISFVCVL